MATCDLIIPCAPHHQVDAGQVLAYLTATQNLLAAQNLAYRFHLWIVLDGPSSTPPQVWEKLKAALANHFTLISLPTNQGKGAALKAALNKAQGKYTFYADADLPYPPSELVKMVQALRQGADVVVGSRQSSYYQQLPRLRIWISKGFAWLNRLCLGPDNDTQGGLKGMNRLGRFVFRQALARRYLFDLDALYRAHAAKLAITSIPIEIRTALQFKNYTLRNYAQEFWALFKSYGHLLIWPLLALFFYYLTHQTFSIDEQQQYHIGYLVFHDYAANLPLVRSFSWGWNFPPEYPVYAFEPIRYHYLYFLLIGLIERCGLPLDWAFNLPTVLGFLILLGLIFQQSYRWFKSKVAAYLTVFFFLFPGHGLVADFRQRITQLHWPNFWPSLWHNDHFVGNYPWEQNNLVASSLWNLNVYLNQRHFIWAMAFVLALFIYFTSPKFLKYLHRQLGLGQLFKNKIPTKGPNISLRSRAAADALTPSKVWITCALWAVGMGAMPLWHLPSLIGLAVVMLSLLILVPRGWPYWVMTNFLALSLMLLVNFTCFNFLHPNLTSSYAFWHPFWMLGHLSVFLKFWYHNLGWHLIFFPLGLWAAGKKRRYALPGIILFALGSLFRFTELEVNQHKIFCFAFLWIMPFSAWGLVWLAQLIAQTTSKLMPSAVRLAQVLPLFFAAYFAFCLMRGGLFDLIPIMHQPNYPFFTRPSDHQVLAWIKNNTPPNASFISNHPSLNFPLMAGRRMFYSWPSYAAGLGYPGVVYRGQINFAAYTWPSPRDKTAFDFTRLCHLMQRYTIDYAIFENWNYYVAGDQPLYDLQRLTEQKAPDFSEPISDVAIYTQENICQGITPADIPAMLATPLALPTLDESHP